jgi:hypothetical protein
MLVPVESSQFTKLDTTPLWRLELVCGHLKWCKPKYKPLPEGEPRRKRDPSEVMPPPKRSGCRGCQNLFWQDRTAFRRAGQEAPTFDRWLENRLREVRGEA